MKTWVKLYTDLLDDPDIGEMCPANRGWWMMLLALAGRLDTLDGDERETGALDTMERITWHLRCSIEDIRPAIEEFERLGMMHETAGVLYLTNYPKRQARPPSERPSERLERLRTWRQSKRKQRKVVTSAECNEGETTLQARTNEDDTSHRKEKNRTDTEKKRVDADAERARTATAAAPKRAGKAPVSKKHDTAGLAACHRAWQDARGGAVNAMDGEQVTALCDEYGADWVEAGIQDANKARQGKLVALNFVKAILERWKREGFRVPMVGSGKQAKARDPDMERAIEFTRRRMEEAERQK